MIDVPCRVTCDLNRWQSEEDDFDDEYFDEDEEE